MRLFFLKLIFPILAFFTVSCDELNQNAFSSILDPAFVSINSLRPKFIMNVQPNLPIQGDCKAITGGVQIIGNKKTLIEVPCIENTFRATIPSSNLSVGFWRFRAEVMDYPKKNGDLKKAYSRTYQVEIEQDTTPPTINIISPLIGTSINTTNESSLLVSGTCSESGRTVTLSQSLGTLACNSRGFSGNIDFSSLADGIISLTASQTDLAGNTGTSSPVTLTKDTTPPTVNITSPVTGTEINTTNASSFLVSGICSEGGGGGGRVTLSHGAGSLTCNSGNFSGNIDFSAVSDGTFSLTASQTDLAGNTGTSSAVNLTKDTGLPTVTITSPVTGTTINSTNESSLLVSGTCSESGRTVSLSHGSGSLTCNSGTFSGNINFSSLSDGSFSLTASQTDSLGNIGTSSAVSLTKDTGLPTVAITSPVTGTSINTTNESSLLVSGTCSESGRTVSLSHGTGSLTCNGGNFSGNINFSAVADGTFLLTASQTDASNNTATSSAVNLTKDTGLPTVAITIPVAGSSINTTNESSLLVTGTCSESGRTVSLSHGTGSLTCNGGNFSGNINFSAVADGTFLLTASQTDASNNTATSSAVNLTKDTGLPTVTITSPVNGTSINTANESSLLVSGTCSESGRTVSLSHGSGSLTCNSSNSFSGNINFSSLSDGSFSLTASQTDASNNTATSSAVSLTKDTGLPTVTITNPVTGTSINTANESSLLVSGTCSESGRTVSLSHGSGSLTCNSSNSFSGNINFSSLSDGSLSLTASQTDASNNTATSSAVNLTKDTGLPTVTITSPVTGTSINTANESSLLVSGTCSESGRTVSLSHSTGSLTCNGGNFSGDINFSTVSDGSFSLTASQTDASGNIGTSSAVNLTKDTGLPTVTITSPVTGTSINTANESSLLVSGTCSESGRTVSLSHGSGSLTCNSSNSFSGNINFSSLSDGDVSLTASQTDAFGNTGVSSAVTLTKSTGRPMISVWRTLTNNEEVDLPLKSGSSYNYNFRVNWGDGSPESIVTSFDDTDKAHTYVTSGDYTITITGVVEAWGSNSSSIPYQNQIIEVSDLGEMGWKDLSSAFYRCTSLTAVSGGDTSKVTSMSSMFSGATSANPDVSNWDTSKVIDMSTMFYRATNANPDVSNWDTSKVTSMSSMFSGATSANPDVSNWDTSKVTRMTSMFYNATNANPDVSNWDTSKVTDMNSMFSRATSANPDVSNWDTSKVTAMTYMFDRATSANPDVSNWDTSKVTRMTSMFYNATNANPDVSNWNTSKVTTMNNVFARATVANPDVSNWNTSKVTSMSSMFQRTTSANPDVSNWDTSKVTRMTSMFNGATVANPDVSNWDTSKVTSMSSMFQRTTSANPDVSNWNTSKVTNMNSMFSDAIAANPDTRNWDTSKVTSMSNMFSGATSANPDVSNWDTSKVTSMSSMFSGATSANPDVSNWDTSMVIYMNNMFNGATNANPDVSNWDTSKVTNMRSIFHGATNANPDVSNWNTSMVTTMTNMFYYATNANPDLRSFDFTSLRTTGPFDHFGAFISFSGISTLNYSNLLINLDSQVIHESVITRAGEPFTSPAQYNSSASAARVRLVSDGWVISDGGLESP